MNNGVLKEDMYQKLLSLADARNEENQKEKHVDDVEVKKRKTRKI